MTAAPRQVDHLVIGGGPAGSIAALRLAAAGRQVVLLEKEPGAHHKVCGEFLSREAVEYLHQAGIDPLELGAAVIHSLRLSAGGRAIETPLPFPALSLSRRVLDSSSARARRRKRLPGPARHPRRIADRLRRPRGLSPLSNGKPIRAKTVFLATGKHDLRGFSRAPAKQIDLVGFKLHWRLAPAQLDALREVAWSFFFSPADTEGSRSSKTTQPISAWSCAAPLCAAWRLAGTSRCDPRENRHLQRFSAELPFGRALWPFRPSLTAISRATARPLARRRSGRRDPFFHRRRHFHRPAQRGPGRAIFSRRQSTADYSLPSRKLTRIMALATWLSRAAVTRRRPRPGAASAVAFSQCDAHGSPHPRASRNHRLFSMNFRKAPSPQPGKVRSAHRSAHRAANAPSAIKRAGLAPRCDLRMSLVGGHAPIGINPRLAKLSCARIRLTPSTFQRCVTKLSSPYQHSSRSATPPAIS